MKLQLLAELGSDQQSTFRSELAEKEMAVLELRKEIEVNINCCNCICVFTFCI